MRAISRWALSSATALLFAAAAFTAAGADTISHEELMHMIQTASTRADHEEIAAIYHKQASADLAAAEEHRRMGRFYKGVDPTGGTRSTYGTMAVHCNNLAEGYARAAKEHTALAELHRKAAAGAH